MHIAAYYKLTNWQIRAPPSWRADLSSGPHRSRRACSYEINVKLDTSVFSRSEWNPFCLSVFRFAIDLRRIVDLDILRNLREILGDTDTLEVIIRDNSISLSISISPKHAERALVRKFLVPLWVHQNSSIVNHNRSKLNIQIHRLVPLPRPCSPRSRRIAFHKGSKPNIHRHSFVPSPRPRSSRPGRHQSQVAE